MPATAVRSSHPAVRINNLRRFLEAARLRRLLSVRTDSAFAAAVEHGKIAAGMAERLAEVRES